ncbi:ribosomal RNA small subunit methyltransferase H [Clostridium sp. CAG:628]|mgnify:FL=1|nr:ribosomal RNA small subunit methyltransferase H [Clostridium sp. CAG:628]
MHKSVLLIESINGLNIKPDGTYIDCTLGYAGHSGEILKRLETEGFLFAFDQDEEAVNFSYDKLSKIGNNFKIFHTNFRNIKECITDKVDGILFDLGVSSPQLDDASRGFSFHKDAPLDMRMDKRQELDAYKVVNTYPLEKLIDILYIYGEEVNAKSIAKGIISNRPINTTLELANVIKENVPISYRKKSNPCRKTFQAIRIEVNSELSILEKSLMDAFSLLKSNGRMCVITFHSLEDRIVKNVFKKLCSDDINSKNLPVVPLEMRAKAKLITKKPIIPSGSELELNNRSRSAKLRIIEKL